MTNRQFKVTNKNNYYFGKEGVLVRENIHDLVLRISTKEVDSNLIFDKSEVEEII